MVTAYRRVAGEKKINLLVVADFLHSHGWEFEFSVRFSSLPSQPTGKRHQESAFSPIIWSFLLLHSLTSKCFQRFLYVTIEIMLSYFKFSSNNEDDKPKLVEETRLQLKQIKNRFINQMKRNWHSNSNS
ncbi:hypothetical protein LXL04_030663 [Taraxacum kok-saghyz]